MEKMGLPLTASEEVCPRRGACPPKGLEHGLLAAPLLAHVLLCSPSHASIQGGTHVEPAFRSLHGFPLCRARSPPWIEPPWPCLCQSA